MNPTWKQSPGFEKYALKGCFTVAGDGSKIEILPAYDPTMGTFHGWEIVLNGEQFDGCKTKSEAKDRAALTYARLTQ